MLTTARMRSASSYVSDNVFDGTRPLTRAHSEILHRLALRHAQKYREIGQPPRVSRPLPAPKLGIV